MGGFIDRGREFYLEIVYRFGGMWLAVTVGVRTERSRRRSVIVSDFIRFARAVW